MNKSKLIKGSCTCKKVQFSLPSKYKSIWYCHCKQCQKFGGNYGAYLCPNDSDLNLISQSTLKWVTHNISHVRRGFCSDCGCSLFWENKNAPYLCVHFGGIDTIIRDLKPKVHIWYKEKGNYYEIKDDVIKFDRWADFEKLNMPKADFITVEDSQKNN